MNRPNDDQIMAATAILKAHYTRNGNAASDTMLRSTVFSMASALGAPGQPAAEYAEVIEQATAGGIKVRPMITEHPNGTIEITGENPMGLPVGMVLAAVQPEPEDEDEEDDADAWELLSLEEVNALTKPGLISYATEFLKLEIDPKQTKPEILKTVLNKIEVIVGPIDGDDQKQESEDQQ